jgi:hypothetical protein
LNATAVTTSGNQTYAGAVTLGADTNLTGSNLITTSCSTVAGAGFSMNVTGNDFIGGDITGVNALTVSGTTAMNANVSTTGSQTYTGTMTLGANATLLAPLAGLDGEGQPGVCGLIETRSGPVRVVVALAMGSVRTGVLATQGAHRADLGEGRYCSEPALKRWEAVKKGDPIGLMARIGA